MRDFVITPEPDFDVDPAGLTNVLHCLAGVARTSPDKWTQNAAGWCLPGALASPYPSLFCVRANRPLYPDPRCDTDRDVKLALTVHAEEGVCSGGSVKPSNAQLVALWAACPNCARAIVLAGFKGVWTLDMPCPDRWRKSIELGHEILQKSGVKVYVIRPQFELGATWLYDGKVFTL